MKPTADNTGPTGALLAIPGNVEITVRGNVYAATCFLHGLAVEEADRQMLEEDDFAYPMVICVRARRGD